MDTIEAFRRFNRFYTRLLGLFNRRLLDSPLSLAEARAIFEIVASPGISAAELSRKLGMDRSQLSRILARLLKQNLIKRHGLPAGRKVLPLQATPSGHKVLLKLETAADHQAAELIGSLDSIKRARLRSAMFEIEALLTVTDEVRDRAPGCVRLRAAVSGDLGWIISRHAEIYGREYGFSQEFENYVLLGLAEYVKKDRSGSRVWIAEKDGASIGSVGVVELPQKRAQLRWLIVEPHARGLGVGRKLVEQVVSFCRDRDRRQVLLWTLQDLHAARALYKSFGFKLVEKKKGIMGGREMIEECWRLTLANDSKDPGLEGPALS